MSRDSASRFARICGYAALLSLGRLIEAAWHTGIAVQAFWLGVYVILAAAFDFYAWNRA